MSTCDVVYALRDLIQAETEERLAREGYDGGSWGYHGHYLITATAKAAEKLEEELNSLIDARVALVLAQGRRNA